MGSSRTAAPLTDNSDMTSDANAGWPAQRSEDMMPSNGQQFDAMPMDFEFGPTAQEFGALPDYSTLEGGLTGYDYSSSSNFINNMNGDGMIHGNHFNGNFEEAVSAKTPGYHNIDAETAEHLSSVVHNSTPAHSVHNYHSYGAQTPFQPSIETYDAKTPYVAPTPYTSPNHSSSGYAGGEIPDLDLDDNGALPSEDFDPGPSPMEETFPTSRPSTPPTPKSGPTKKTSTPRKAKSKAKAAIASKQDEDTDEGRSLLSTRGKGKGKAKQPVILDDEEELDDNDGETPTTGSSNKGKGRKRAAAPKTPKTPTSTPPSKKSKTGTAAKKSTKKTTAVDLSTMGHQRVRKAPKDGIAQVKPIPHSFDECDIADQTLITMRDAGHTWNECKARYAELEGVTHGNSTIPNRYERLKTAFINMREEDNLRLFNIKKKLEDDFNSKKWALIAAEIIKDGGAEYDPDDLRRRFKQLMEKSGFLVEEGLAKEDVDFKINVDDEGEEGQQESPEPMRKQPEITWMGDEDEENDALGGGEQEDYEDTSYTQHHHRRNSRESAHMDVDDDEDEGGDDLAY